MGRRPTKNLNLPKRMRARQKAGGIYYYYDTGGKPRKEIPLGNSYATAVQKWAELEQGNSSASNLITFKDITDRYVKEVIPTKAARTQLDNIKSLKKILEFFNNPPVTLDAIEALHVRQYLDLRGQSSKVQANRERALISHIWNNARQWGYTNKINPCQGVEGFTETPREVYIEDNIYKMVYEVACQPLKDAIDLAYLVGQRPADTIKLSEIDIQDGVLHVKQGKTGSKVRVSINGQLKQVIDRIILRKATFKVRCLALISTETGRPISQNAIRIRFDKARLRAIKKNPEFEAQIKQFQFRDLRAKAGTDIAESDGDVRTAQKLLGHASQQTTEIYVRRRKGELVNPTR